MRDKGQEYNVDISEEYLQKFIEFLREGDKIPGIFGDIELTSGGNFIARSPEGKDMPDYKTKILIGPQKDTVRIEVFNEYPGDIFPAKILAWGTIRAELERSGYRISNVTGFNNTAVLEHRYEDPSKIPNPRERIAIEGLIRAEKGPLIEEGKAPRWVRDYEIAKESGISPSYLSEVKYRYMRPEEKVKVNKRGPKPKIKE